MYYDEMMHYGIKGQKWGVRRFQNEDGSYTSAGKERYNKGSPNEKAESKEEPQAQSSGAQQQTNNSDGITRKLPPSIAVDIAALAANVVKKEIRRKHARKEVEESHLNDEKERVTEKDIKKLTRFNKKERKEILDRMKKNPEMTFMQARKPTLIKSIFKSIAKHAAIALSIVFLPRIIKAVKNSPAFMNFMKSIKRNKIKNAVQLSSDEYSITDAPEKLTPAVKRLMA